MSSVCLASGASAWSHVAPGDSPVGSPHTPECMPLNCVLECSLSLLSLAFLHSAFFFFPHGSSWLFDGLNYWELQAILTGSNLIFATQFRVCKHPSPIGRQPVSQNMLTCAKCYWYELPEQFFYPIFHKTDIPHKVHTQIFIQTHVIWKKKKKSKGKIQQLQNYCLYEVYFIISKLRVYPTRNLLIPQL